MLYPVLPIFGWNVHVYHSHLDVHPRVPAQKPYRFEWHQDGGRQNREVETDPRPRLSVKLAFWLSGAGWGPRLGALPEDVPLYFDLCEGGHLDPGYPPLRP